MRAKRNDMPLLRRLAGVLAVLAALPGTAGWLLFSGFGGLACFDSCPPPDVFSFNMLRGAAIFMMPTIVLALLALLAYLGYRIAVRQVRAVLVPVLALVGCAGVFVGMFSLGMSQIGAASDLAYEDTLVQWTMWWGFALVLLAIAWAALVFYLTREPAKSPAPPVAV